MSSSTPRAALAPFGFGLRFAVDVFTFAVQVGAAAIEVPIHDGEGGRVIVTPFDAADILTVLILHLQVQFGVHRRFGAQEFVVCDVNVRLIDGERRAVCQCRFHFLLDILIEAGYRGFRHHEIFRLLPDIADEVAFGVAQGFFRIGGRGVRGGSGGRSIVRSRLRSFLPAWVESLIWFRIAWCSCTFSRAICSSSRWRITSR